MKILCGAFTKQAQFVMSALIMDEPESIPLTIFILDAKPIGNEETHVSLKFHALEEHQVIPFDAIEHVVLLGDMDQDIGEFTMDDFDGSVRRGQRTIDKGTWRKIKQELKQRGVFLHDRH